MEDEVWVSKIFFGEIVDCYMLADLAEIEKNFDPANECGNCNFPLALQIFSCMDFIGWLISIPKNESDDTSSNIKSFISNLFSDISKQQVEEVTKFIKIFRHGLAHEYFAKNAGISRNGTEFLSIDLNKEVLVLDADVLLKEFRSAIEALRQRVDTEDTLGTQIKARYQEMQKNNSLVTKGLISKSQGRNTTTRSTNLKLPVYPSNASVAPPITLPPELIK